MKCCSIFSVTSKSAMTPSFIGLIATMLPGVRPSMSLASLPTASTRPLTLLMATIEGSLTTMPLPRAYTQVLAVPRSIARSLENKESIERRLNESSFCGRVVQKRQGRPGLGSVVGGSDGGLNTVLPGVLDLIHRFIRSMDELFRRRGHIGQRGHADRCGEVNVEAILGQKLVGRDPLANTLADRIGAFAAGIGQDQRKFVAAEARDDVGLSGALANHRRRLHERAAAEQVPVRVVDGLEPVEVDEQQRQRAAAARGALGFLPQDQVQIP